MPKDNPWLKGCIMDKLQTIEITHAAIRLMSILSAFIKRKHQCTETFNL